MNEKINKKEIDCEIDPEKMFRHSFLHNNIASYIGHTSKHVPQNDGGPEQRGKKLHVHYSEWKMNVWVSGGHCIRETAERCRFSHP